MLTNNYHAILWEKEYTASKTRTGKHKWVLSKMSEPQEISHERYNNYIASIPCWKRAGKEYDYWNDTCAGNQCTRITSVSPLKDRKIVREFSIKEGKI